MTLILARELVRYGVTVNCIAPRARTPMTEAMPMFTAPESGFDGYDPANVSPTVAWLASDAAGDVNGQVFVVLGDSVHRVEPTAIASSISNGGQRWTVDQLAEASAELFAGADSGIPAWGGPGHVVAGRLSPGRRRQCTTGARQGAVQDAGQRLPQRLAGGAALGQLVLVGEEAFEHGHHGGGGGERLE